LVCFSNIQKKFNCLRVENTVKISTNCWQNTFICVLVMYFIGEKKFFVWKKLFSTFQIWRFPDTLPEFHGENITREDLGIMRTQFRAPVKPLNFLVPWCSRGFRGSLNCTSMILRNAGLSYGLRLIAVVFPVWPEFCY